MTKSYENRNRAGVTFWLGLVLFYALTLSSTNGQDFIQGATYQYCISNTSGDPCLYYLCDTYQCVSCYTDADLESGAATNYLMVMDTENTFCSTYNYDSTQGLYICEIEDSYYGSSYYGEYGWMNNYYGVSQDILCVDKNTYFIDSSTGDSTCSDTVYYPTVATVIDFYLVSYTLGCDHCYETGYYLHAIQDITYLVEYYIDLDMEFLDFASYYSLYPYYAIRSCAAGSDGGACSATYYYDSSTGSCFLCSCKFAYCIYCTASECLIYVDDLSYYSDYYELLSASCDTDPCLVYETGTNNCKICPSYLCVYSYITTSYNCDFYSYLFVDSNTTVCAFKYVYTNSQQYCQVGSQYYQDESYYLVSYNATASEQKITVYCVACDLYFVDSSGNSICSDSCANSDPTTSVEDYIDGLAVGCGVCATGYKYQELTAIGFISDVYMKQCSASSGGKTCSIIEYYNPYYDDCQRCACKFTDCAACTIDECILYSDTTIPIINCTYHDPCISYVNGTGNCETCTLQPIVIYSATDLVYYTYSYKLMIIDSNTTICATYGAASQFGYSDVNNYICGVLDTYYVNKTAYFNKTYYAQGIKQYCIDCDTYFVDSSGAALCGDSCYNLGTGQNYLERSITSYSVGCGACAQDSYLMQRVTPISHITGLYLTSCEANDVSGLYCSLTEYFSSSGECLSCSSLFDNCAACNETYCYICAENFYYSSSYTYDYSLSDYVYTTQCLFMQCPSGQGIIDLSQICNDCNITNCHSCALNSTSSLAYCTVCNTLYTANTLGSACVLDSTTQKVLTYYIATGASYNVPTSKLSSYENSTNDSSPSNPYYFIQSALYNISQMSITYKNINATIYIGKGNHFFFFCDTYWVNGNNLTEYCDSTNYKQFSLRFIKAKFQTDNITLNIVGLSCHLRKQLNIGSNSNFTSMCYSSTDSKPTIYINQAYAYFNLYGTTQFKNLKFSGINQFAKIKNSLYQLSTLPLLYCQAENEPSPSDTTLTLTQQSTPGFPLSFYCQSVFPSFNNIPKSTLSYYTCSRNSYNEFYKYQESTLAATGEPDKSDFFYQGDTFVKTNSGIPPKRRNILFNILSYAEYQSYSGSIPQLTISNCDFEYFLGGYDSLINVDNAQFYNATVSQRYNGASNNLGTQNWEFFVYNGGEKGGKIFIYNSTFSHSSFSKGLIVYRKQPYITPSLGISNLTYFYMQNPLVVDEGSYIFLQDSTFYNLNFMTNVTALAIYGGSTVESTFYNYLSTTTVYYPVFMHQGIVLNIEDFGGDIKILNCNFTANMHFIPEILITNHTSSITKSTDSFKDSSISLEYKIAECDQNTFYDKFFFQNGLDQSDQIDAYYDSFERLSTIYVSRNRGTILIRDNNFTENMGTFGGAISINSMDRQQNTTNAFIIMYKNTFTKNMAYLSGNAVYIRMTKSLTVIAQVCGGGVSFVENTFTNNIGMKVHNGGAIAASCTFIQNTHQDYYQISSTTISDSDTIDSYKVVTDYSDGTKYMMSTYAFHILENEFTENYSGLKGTAVYLHYISYPKVEDSTFTQNGPVLSHFETLYSPYYTYFSQRTMTYYDQYGVCLNEFSFMAQCVSENSYIDFSHVQGALYVGHCEESQCIDSTNTMQFYISGTTFDNNQVGPVLDEFFPDYLASQLFIEGGFHNYLADLVLNGNAGTYFSIISDKAQQLINYFPSDYFYQQHASLITIYVNPIASYASSALNFYTEITSCTFEDNNHFQVLGLTDSQVYEGSLIKYLSYFGTTTTNFIPSISIGHTYFYDNQFIGPSSSLVYVNNGILYFDSNIATNNGKISSLTSKSPTRTIFDYNPFEAYSISLSQKYGIVKISGSEILPNSLYHQITSNQFTYSFAEFGSVYNMYLENQYGYFYGNTYKYNFASKQGSILNGLGSLSQSLIVMDEEDISYQFSLNGTLAVTSFNLNTMSLILNNTIMTQFYSTEGSAINLLKAQKVILNNCVFKQDTLLKSLSSIINEAYDYKSYSLSHYIDTQSFQNLLVNNITSQKAQIYIDSVDGSSQNDFASILTQSDTDTYAAYVEANNCQFMNLYAQSGSVFYVTSSQLKYYNDEGSANGIFNCSQKDSGVIYVSNYGEFVGLNLVIQDSYSFTKSSVLLLSQVSEAKFYNTKFINNYALTQGTAIVEGSSSLSCTYCTFVNNYATDSSIIFADNNPEGSITIQYSHFENNTMTNNLFYMIYTTCMIKDTMFLNNIAQKVNHGLTLSNSYLTMDNITVDYTDVGYLDKVEQDVDTGFININFYSLITITKSIFSNVRGRTSGVLYATGSSNVTIDNNTLFQNCYAQSGSILYLASTDAVSISKTSFINNTLSDLQFLSANATLKSNYFYKGNEQFIYAESSSLEIFDNHFDNGQNTEVAGKAIYCYCINLTVVNSIFSNLQAAEGGAIYITSYSLSSVFNIHDNFFIQNSAQSGGAIYIEDAPLVTIFNNSFIENTASVISPQTQLSSTLTAKGQGGAIFFNCLNSNLGLDGNCIVKIQKNNSFLSNVAEDEGGAIIWIKNDYLDDGTNIFSHNLANYGSDVASYPKELSIEFLTNNDYYEPVSNTRLLQDDPRMNRYLSTDGFSQLVSGTPFEFLIYIYDQQGNVYTADSVSVATISASSSDVLLKNSQITAVNGVYNFSNILVYCAPDTAFSLGLDITGLETYGNSISFIDSPIDISVAFRGCVAGEELTSSQACVACSNGTYAYTAPTGESSCQACSQYATCYGKNITSPLPGYWRANSTTESWVVCPRAANCLGGNETNTTGVCADGYRGIACGICLSEYSNTSPFTCAACPPRVRNIVQITLIMVFAACYSAFLVKSTMQSANKAKPLYSVYLKIMTNHFQIIGAISNIDFDWPSQIQSFFNAQTTTASVSTQIFSFDCFLFGNRFADSIGVYYEKLIFYGLSPFILTFLSMVYWVIYCRVKKNYTYFKDCFISTVVVLLFLIHPNISSAMFSAFNCIELDGTYYLRGDVNSECYKGNHLFFIYVVIVPSIVIWVIGIPLFALLCLYTNKIHVQKAEMEQSELTDQEKVDVYRVKMKYGFLFNGYSPEKYFWEILVLYRKIILIMTTVFLSVVSPESQVLVSLMVVIINTFAHIFYDPFYTVTLNKMELYSLQVASITMYCGLFYITGEHYTYMSNDVLKWFFLVCLIMPNGLFFLYWIFYMQLEVIKIAIYKHGKLFSRLTCGCINIEKFKARFPQDEKPQSLEEQARIQEILFKGTSSIKRNDESSLVKGPEEVILEFKKSNEKPKKNKKQKNITDKSKSYKSIENDIELVTLNDSEIDFKKLQNEAINNRRRNQEDQDDYKEQEKDEPKQVRKGRKITPIRRRYLETGQKQNIIDETINDEECNEIDIEPQREESMNIYDELKIASKLRKEDRMSAKRLIEKESPLKGTKRQ